MDDLQEQKAALKFANVSEAVFAESYVEQILSSEHNWISSRLSWLFISQSFCITAYTILVTSSIACRESMHQAKILTIAIPVMGIIFSVFVGLSVQAGALVAKRIANARAQITQYVNTHADTTIPLIGGNPIFRQSNIRSTAWLGALPHWLPWILVTFWLLLLVY
ncbi:MAG: hypothetical protein V4568_19170 [Pseudomonadota bacterium]